MDLPKFVELFNLSLVQEMSEDLGATCTINHALESCEMFYRFFVSPETRTRIGISELGKPAVLLALKQLGLYNHDLSFRTSFRFLFGSWFESIITNLMVLYKVPLTQQQHEVQMGAHTGHIDGIVGDYVVEIKTLSATNYKRFSAPLSPDGFIRYQTRDIYGYTTQLACYSHLLSKPGVWLVLNKATYELALVYPDKDLAAKALERAYVIVDTLPLIKTPADVVKYFEPPDVVVSRSGVYKLPEDMEYSEYKDVFYDIQDDVIRHKPPAEIESQIKLLMEKRV